MDRYLELAQASPGEAEAFLSNALCPSLPLQLAFRDRASGELLGVAGAIDVITEDVLGRGAAAGPGDRTFAQSVRRQVAEARREAQRETIAVHLEDPFATDAVDTTLESIRGNRRSLRSPRSACRSQVRGGRLTTWAIVSLVAVLGLVPTAWMLEVVPI